MSVYTVGKVISQTVQLNLRNIIQSKYLTVRQRLDDNVLKLFRLLQTSFVTNGILESLVTTFTELSRSRFYILFSQSGRYVVGDQFILSHYVRSQPDTHGVVLTHHTGITYALYTLNLRNQVDFCIVLDESICICIGFIVKREYYQHGCLTFLSSHTNSGNFGR